jgi:hypothetical protein
MKARLAALVLALACAAGAATAYVRHTSAARATTHVVADADTAWGWYDQEGAQPSTEAS